LVVYATLFDFGPQQVERIVGGHGIPLFTTADTIERLSVTGGVVEAVSQVHSLGDGCGCLTAPAWSPDGSEIAYLDGIHDSYGDLSASVAVMNADGTGRHALAPAAAIALDTEDSGEAPSWSPDGKRIAYVDDSEIGVVNIDGSDSPGICVGCENPAWSPDGSKIAFQQGSAIYVMNPDGSDVQKLAVFTGDLYSFAWSPDGTRIAYSLNQKLHVMNADGSNRRPLGTSTTGDEPAWSPDSSQIVFDNYKGLAVIGSDGTGRHQLTRGFDYEPSWSPDGKTIVFASYRDDPYQNAQIYAPQLYSELYLVNPDGSNLRPLSFTQPSSLKNQITFHTPTGQPLPKLPGAPALAGNIAAVASKVGSTRQIELYVASTGELLAVVAVGKAAGRVVIVGGDNNWVVFREGHTICALNTSTHAIVRLTTTTANALDLSVSGRHVAWAENTHGHGRIRELELPN
jgi:TolB protein